MVKSFLLSFCVFLSIVAVGQEIEGSVLDKETNEPIPFLNVFNKTTKKGTITNTDGYFRLAISSVSDTIILSQVGYKKQTIRLVANEKTYTIYLEQNVQRLEEVVIQPEENPYLFQLVSKCKKNESSDHHTAKAYYELKSYKDSSQVELVEGFYNAESKGYDILDLELKAARLAVQPYKNRVFTSQASSRAISLLKLTGNNEYFPSTPFDLSSKEAKRRFYLSVESAYKDEKNDSIYVVRYRPKSDYGNNFQGRVWINISDFNLEKITMNCANCKVHPFLPLFPDDSILNVNLAITKSYIPANGKMVFNQVNFSYSVDYKSRVYRTDKLDYRVQTNAVLYAYDFSAEFNLPKFDFAANVDDYRKINALPYNEFFWNNNDEYRLNDVKNSNQAFFADPKSVTNVTFFKSKNTMEASANKIKGFFEHPYIQWSPNRVFIKEAISDTGTVQSTGSIKSQMYNLDVKIFADLNSYNDSTALLTATVLDPYTTFYYLPMDQYTNCFINMYFDLCEIERRNWVATTKPNAAGYEQSYRKFMEEFNVRKELFMKETERGTNRKQMEKWNVYIKGELKIDNLELFQLYTENGE